MAEFKIDYKLTGPQMYEDGRKLMRDSTRSSVTINADTYDAAKEQSKKVIKNSKTYSIFQDRFKITDPPIKPRISFLKKIAKALKTSGKGGSGSQQYEGTKEIFPRPTVNIDRLKKQSGGRIDKALPRGSRDI